MMYWNYGLLRELVCGLGMLAFLALLAVVVFVVVRGSTRSGTPGAGSATGAMRPTGAAAGSDSALSILRDRYARGEITREQYEEMRQTLADRS